MQGSLSDLIIDRRNQENIISKDVVERLQLKTETHPISYAIGWINEVGGIQVHEHCKVSFSIGKCRCGGYGCMSYFIWASLAK